MSKKIVILNGSPRKSGNTSALVTAFREGAEGAGHTVTEFFLDKMNIHGCKGCFGGHSDRECPCVQQDDMNQIYPAVRDCDVVVLASPLYYWTMSGQLRTAFDRLFALINEVRVHPGATLVMTGKRSPAEKFVRPDVCTRLTWGAVFHIMPLDGEMWQALSEQARERGIEVTAEAEAWMKTYLPRDIKVLSGLLSQMDRELLARKKAAVTVPALKAWLAKHGENL